ncbi:MAG: hypothetical protein HQL73_08450 [Magnetococcales bacterium]|nr:hypothetical protein [Magnetococcales bacterium]
MAMTGAAGQQRVPGSFLKESTFGLPGPREQLEILEFIRAETAKTDQTIEKAQKEIELVREYRERLIADVVTGKLDVRDVPVELPAEDMVEDLEEEGADDLMEDDSEPEEVEE